MIICGLDPGSRKFGIGLLRIEGGEVEYLRSETLILKETNLFTRMETVWQGLNRIFSGLPVREAALEEGFLGRNVHAMNVLAQIRGLTIAALINSRIPVQTYSPATVKKAVTGNGNASKEQVKHMMKRLLELRGRELQEDESDALSVAYCHCLARKIRSLERRDRR